MKKYKTVIKNIYDRKNWVYFYYYYVFLYVLLVKIAGFIKKNLLTIKLLHKDNDYSFLKKRKQKPNRGKCTQHISKILIKIIGIIYCFIQVIMN